MNNIFNSFMYCTLFFLFGIFLFSLVSGADFSATSGNYQYIAPDFNDIYTSQDIDNYWPILREMENGNCQEGTDFLVSILPGGCSPAVVRSDLLADQKVPIFCQLSAIKINPLIQVSSIKSISFSGEKPKGVLDISFHPARAAIRSYNTVLGSPLLNNIGYVVIILDRTKNESSMPDWISGNLTATMYYDIDKAYGTGKAEYLLPVISDDEWKTEFKNSAFWNGKGFLRTESIEGDKARISVYLDNNKLYKTVDLGVGEESSVFYFPFSYCKAGLQVKLNSIEAEEDKALLNVDGDQIWVKKGSKILNDRCTVKDLRILADGSGSIDISCPKKSINLHILPKGARFKIGSEEREFSIGAKINSKYTLVYSGILPDKIQKGGEFVVISNSTLFGNYNELTKLISEKIYSISNSKESYSFNKLKNEIEGKYKDVFILGLNNNKDEIEFEFVGRVDGVQDIDLSSNPNAGYVINEYIEKSEKAVKELVEIYPSDKEKLSDYSFAEEALFDSIINAKKIGNMQLVIELGELFIKQYPDSKSFFSVQNIIGNGKLFDLSLSHEIVYVNNEEHYISLDEFKILDKTKKTARLVIPGVINEEVHEGQLVKIDDKNSMEIQKVKIGEVDVVYHRIEIKDGKSLDVTSTVTLKEEETKDLYGRNVLFRGINVQKVAYVSLNPHIDNSKSSADFTFKIGVEKRNIKLSDEKTKEMIKNLNESIKKWEDINTKLGSLIKVWKGTCFATSIILMAKSTIAGFTGQGIARQKVMEAYRDECDRNPKYKEMSRTQCYNFLSNEIDRDVDSLTKSIKTNNDLIKQFQEKCHSTEGSLFSGPVVNEDCVKKEMKTIIKQKLGNPIEIDFGNGKQYINIDSIDDYDLLRMLLAEKDATLKNGVTYNSINNEINARLKPFALIAQEDKARADAARELGSVYSDNSAARINDLNTQTRERSLWSGDTLGKLSDKRVIGPLLAEKTISTIQEDTPVQFVQYNGRPYLLILQAAGSSGEGVAYTAKYVLEENNGEYTLLDDGYNLPPIIRSSQQLTVFQIKNNWIFYSGGSCSNPYTKAEVKYYESGNAKGMPAIVPINLKEGWYAKVSQSPGGIFSSEEQGYKQSGQVSLFYLCNVGKDGLEKNGKWPDDICMSIDTNNYAKYTEFAGCPSMNGARFKKLIEDAQEAIRQAANQYGQKQVRILGQTIDSGISVDGNNMAECQDFMSPDDCKLLFNVCDPVICPASRCNLGGAYPVSNVIQSGIIGSLVLCLPNIKEGVMVPICLSGVHAGIENFVSILRSERECLQRSLETGEHVGICDEITSIYLCEFFWRQLAPVMNLLIPKMIEMAYGQGTRGGGEYLSVQNSWDNLQKNIDYFKNEYAQNAFRAFEIRSVEEAGGEVCKAFIGTSLPTSASALDNLLDPESPEQITAWFSETLHSEATVPSTSHYKVYFHIFAGNDQGVQYRVYLKNPPSSSYYQSNQIINVKTGYIAKGGIADESIDFTAASGYKELCVDMNAQTKCGFKAVSTGFASEYLTKKYVEQQAKQQAIKTEKECISGTPSVLNLASSGNIQSNVEDAINPSVNLQGLVRVCSTEEPGKAVDTQAVNSYTETSLGRYFEAGADSSGSEISSIDFNKRWQLVGYCDNPNIGCWLDTKSVEDDVKKVEAIEDSLNSIEKQIAKLDNQLNRPTEETVIDILNSIKKELENENWNNEFMINLASSSTKDEIVSRVQSYIQQTETKLIELGGGEGVDGEIAKASSNSDIAKARSLRVKLYNLVTLGLYNKYFPRGNTVEEEGTFDMKGKEEPSSQIDGDVEEVSYIRDINIYDSSYLVLDDGYPEMEWVDKNQDILLHIDFKEECYNKKYSIWEVGSNRPLLEKFNYNYGAEITSFLARLNNEDEFFIEALCINNQNTVIESKNSSSVLYLFDSESTNSVLGSSRTETQAVSE